MSELYFKRGKRYYQVPDNMVSMYDQGRPADGIWEIRDNGRSAHLIGDLPSPIRKKLEQYKEKLGNIILEKFYSKDNISIADVVSGSLDEFALVLAQDINQNQKQYILVNRCKQKWTKPEIHQLGKSDFNLPLEVYVLYCKIKLQHTETCPECNGTGHVKTTHHEREFFVPCKKCHPPI